MTRNQIITRATIIVRSRRRFPPEHRLQGASRAAAAFTLLSQQAPGSERTEAAALTVILWAAEELRWREKREHDAATARAREARSAAGRTSAARLAGLDLAAVRNWGRANGFPVSPRGGVPTQALINAYRQAHAA